jgi:transketolase
LCAPRVLYTSAWTVRLQSVTRRLFGNDQREIIGMHTFGASVPLKALQRMFGFSTERVAEAAKAPIDR